MLAEFLADRATREVAMVEEHDSPGRFQHLRHQRSDLGGDHRRGFYSAGAVTELPSNAPQTKHYDQIAFIAPEVQDQLALSRSGVFNFYDYVYRKEDEALYVEDTGKAYTETKEGKERDEKARLLYNTWRTFSCEHLPCGRTEDCFGKQY